MLLIALAAAVSMLVVDCLSTIMVQAEAANKGWLAGWLDAACWVFSITTTGISVTVLTGHHPLLAKALVVVFVSAANLFGTVLGAKIGNRILHSKMAKGESPLTEQEIAQMRAIMAAARSGR